MTVNGRQLAARVEPRTLLVHVIRESWELTGTKIGCDTSQCGACTVLLDGRAVKSCTILAAQADGALLTTIEGLGQAGRLTILQQQFRDRHGLQCGFCTPGMIMAAAALIVDGLATDEDAVRRGLAGNICRCTGYGPIIQAALAAARATGDSKEAAAGTSEPTAGAAPLGVPGGGP
jgi:carbon-monoxide dehydrogenase small subunit